MTSFNKKKILSILLAISMSLTSCHEIKNIINNNETNDITKEDNTLLPTESSTIMPDLTYSSKDELSETYLSYFYDLEFKYNHEELYPNQETLDKIVTTNEQLNPCTYEFNGDVGALVETIKDNTKEFVELHPEYINPFALNYYEYQEALTKVIVSIKDDCQNNINEDFHQISNMAIVIGATEQFAGKNMDNFYIAYYEEELNALIFNHKYFEALVEKYGYPYSKFLYYILSHEVNHIRENVCPCNYDHEYQNINDINEGYSFITEASAESDLYNTRDFSEIMESFTYEDERKAEGELFLLGILNESLDNYYNAIFDIDYNCLFEFFDLKTKEEKIDFLRMTYSIDALSCRNYLPFILFKDGDTIPEWITLNDATKVIGFTYKENIFKQCMINLIEYTSSHEDFSLQDNLIIFNIIKAYLIDNTYTFDETSGNRIYDQEVLANIDAMEKSYVEYLSQKYQVSIEKIREYENTDICYIIESAKYFLEDEDADYGIYSREAKSIMEKFPVIRGVLMTNLNMPYNVYETRISTLSLSPTK